jgi:spore coat polysaccharide biosynthesis protein SpsF
MTYAAIIQARFSSSRLPGKVLTDICGKPVLQWVIERVQRSKYVDEVFVVTSIERENLPILKLCANLGVRAFAGSENDVLDRYYQLLRLIQPEYLVMVTADCPCYDSTILDTAIEALEPETDYLLDFNETLPDGLDIDIIRFASLERAWREAALVSEREHLSQFLYKHPELFKHQNFSCPYGNYGHLRWTLDEEADLKLIKAIFEHFCGIGKPDFIMPDILAFLESKPELSELNAHIARNEGLAISISNDKEIGAV